MDQVTSALEPKAQHYTALEGMYLAAPINSLYPCRIQVAEARSVIQLEIDPRYFHAAGAVHGSVIFKLLDDAAFFAANSLETDVFVLTTSFTTYLTRPVSTGVLRAEGRVVNRNKSQFIAEAVVYDAHQREIGRGNGIFVRSKLPLNEDVSYKLKV
ncbi:MAG: PaaI family thioesterase [Xanthomonadales bacterium]|nr:PaaI family thioesterase [Xanthomonadales bacterium]